MNIKRILSKLSAVERAYEQMASTSTTPTSGTGGGLFSQLAAKRAGAPGNSLLSPEDQEGGTAEDVNPNTGETLNCQQCLDKYDDLADQLPNDQKEECEKQSANCVKKYQVGIGCSCQKLVQEEDIAPGGPSITTEKYFVNCNCLPSYCNENGVSDCPPSSEEFQTAEGCESTAKIRDKQIKSGIQACCDLLAGLTPQENGEINPVSCMAKLKDKLAKLKRRFKNCIKTAQGAGLCKDIIIDPNEAAEGLGGGGPKPPPGN